MADWTTMDPTTQYTTVLSNLQGREVDSYTLFESPTNQPTGAIRYSRTNDKFQEWNGTTWVDKVISLAGGGTGASTASVARTNLGLGSMALQNNNAVTITGGTIAGLSTLDAPASATSIWSFNAGELDLSNATANFIKWANIGVGAPTFTARSAGVKLALYPNITGSLADIGLGVESQAMWLGVENDADSFYFYHGITRTLKLGYDSSSYGLPTLSIVPNQDSLGARLDICTLSSANAPTFIQSGEPGTNAGFSIISNNYRGTTPGASARHNTSIGGSFIRLENNGIIEFVSISNTGVLSSQGYFDAGSNLFVGKGSGVPHLYLNDGTITGFRSSAGAITLTQAGIDTVTFNTGLGDVRVVSGGWGNTVQGSDLIIGRNTSNLGAAGVLGLVDKNGGNHFLWVDATGLLRISSSPPTADGVTSDTSGVIVGGQA